MDLAPFGEKLPEENPAGLGRFVYNLRFPGHTYDAESGLHYNYFRDYNPWDGRYLQSDPIGLNGGINTYAYVENTPTSLVDFFGLNPGDLFASPDDAAIDAANFARGKAVQKVEYGGWIYEKRVNGKPCYSYNFQSGNTQGIPKIEDAKPSNPDAIWHTHNIWGIPETDAKNENFSGDLSRPENAGDRVVSYTHGLPIYVNTPSGKNKTWSPRTKKERTLPKKVPQPCSCQ